MNTSNISVEKEILSLESKTLLELREIWKSVFNSNPPTHAKKVLIPKLAYKLQEIAYGSLSEKSTRELLQHLGNLFRKILSFTTDFAANSITSQARDQSRHKISSIIILAPEV